MDERHAEEVAFISSDQSGGLRFCANCMRINVERIRPPRSFRLHASLEKLRDCRDSCFLCQQVHSEIVKDKLRYHTIRCEGKHERDYEVRIALDNQNPRDGAVCARVYERVSESHELWEDLDYEAYARSHVGGSYFDVIQVSTTEDDQALNMSSWIRQPGKSTQSTVSLKLAQSWISDCIRGRCFGAEGSAEDDKRQESSLMFSYSGDWPARLVRIEDDGCSLKLVAPDQDSTRYVALSYVWGMHVATWKTIEANLHQREKSSTIWSLPRTLQDAVQITRLLGYAFLWVDCLCIVQDRMDDWAVEASKMAAIYNRAEVTIMADASNDSASGIFNLRSVSLMERTPHVRLAASLAEGRPSALYLTRSDELWDLAETSDSPPSKRAWCAQERAASKRVLHFGRSQLFWECAHAKRSEDNIGRPFTSRISDIDVSRRLTDERIWHEAWYVNFVGEDYSGRDLTFSNDKLNAVAGIAAAFHKLRPNRYLAGHWEENLLESLTWQICTRPELSTENLVYRAPSWSWASTNCKVAWAALFGERFVSSAEILASHTDVEPRIPFGEVKGGFIRLRAPTLTGRLIHGQDDAYSFSFEDCFTEPAFMDHVGSPDDKVVACLLGVTVQGYSDYPYPQTAHMLLLQETQGRFRRVGLLRADYGPEPDDFIRDIGELEVKLVAPIEELTII